MTHFLTLLVLGLTLATTLVEAKAKRIHVTAVVVEQNITGNQIGDQLITTVVLLDPDDDTTEVGTGAGVCTFVRVPEAPTPLQCLITAEFPEGQIIFGGVAPLPVVGVEAHFSILGGTGDFRKARGEAILVVLPSGRQDARFELN